jgi:hypothetical protein
LSVIVRIFDAAILKLMWDLQANGLDMLRKAGIQVILDHHALPGAQSVDQMFAGKCVFLSETQLHIRESDTIS